MTPKLSTCLTCRRNDPIRKKYQLSDEKNDFLPYIQLLTHKLSTFPSSKIGKLQKCCTFSCIYKRHINTNWVKTGSNKRTMEFPPMTELVVFDGEHVGHVVPPVGTEITELRPRGDHTDCRVDERAWLCWTPKHAHNTAILHWLPFQRNTKNWFGLHKEMMTEKYNIIILYIFFACKTRYNGK